MVAGFFPSVGEDPAVHIIARVGVFHSIDQRLVVVLASQYGKEIGVQQPSPIGYGCAKAAGDLGRWVGYGDDILYVPEIGMRTVLFDKDLLSILRIDAQRADGIDGIDSLSF